MNQTDAGQSFVGALRRDIDGDVRDDDGTRAAYASDASNHRVVPTCIVLPRHAEDVARLVSRCSEAGVAVTARGGGTNVAGNAVGPGVVLDFSRYMKRVLDLDPAGRSAVVQPGTVLDDLRSKAAVHGLTFGVDPSTHNRCTLGGMIGTNACGTHSVAWGTTADNVDTIDVVLPDGNPATLGSSSAGPGRDGATTARLLEPLTALADAYLPDIRRELGRFPRQISGYGLQYLLPEKGVDVARAFVGTEGTCALITSARVHLVAEPAARLLVVAGFVDDIAAAAAVPALIVLGALTVVRAPTVVPPFPMAGHGSCSRWPGQRPTRPARSRRRCCGRQRMPEPLTTASSTSRHSRRPSGVSASGALGLPRAVPRAASPGPDGRTRPSHPSGWPIICATSEPC